MEEKPRWRIRFFALEVRMYKLNTASGKGKRKGKGKMEGRPIWRRSRLFALEVCICNTA